MTAGVALPRVEVPDETFYVPPLGVMAATGSHALELVRQMPAGLDVAIDIETPSVTDSFTIKCVTAAWESEGQTWVVLLDPSRVDDHRHALAQLTARARWLVLHNAPFDIPGLFAMGLITLDDIGAKVMDTLVLARAAWPDTLTKKSLEALAPRMLAGMSSTKEALRLAQQASGLTSNEKWYATGDIHIPAYRMGAMADTVVTLRLAWPLFEKAVERQLDHPFAKFGCSERSSAGDLILSLLEANRVMLRRGALGMEVDRDYHDTYVDQVTIERDKAGRMLTEAGLRPGVGQDLVKYLDAAGHIPANWPLTATGKFKTDKETLSERLPDHPLADAHRMMAETHKILGYMDKVVARSRITGRLHPQYLVLGASATGRMSASEPELQQFSELARPVIVCDHDQSGLTSVDWSSIEPALLGWMSGDLEFIGPFEAGADIYEPVMIAAGVSRKTAKVIVLAAMYGQGIRKLAATLACNEDQARALQRGLRAAMPIASKFMSRIKAVADDYGLTVTASGRILTIPRFNGVPAGYKGVNYMFQGSCADLIYNAVITAGRRGIGDDIMIPMHDEIVCNTDVDAEIQEIMSAPPQYLLKWTGGRIPTIRTDAQPMGRSWQKV